MQSQTLNEFYDSLLGRYALNWEQEQFDRMVFDCFGFNALQVGASGKDFLRNNRIGLKVVVEQELQPLTVVKRDNVDFEVVQSQFEKLPFETETIDLVVLPHTLEVADDPYAVMREVSRILIPGGRVVMTGINLFSLWGLRFSLQRFGAKRFLPGKQFMAVPTIKDWLQLLSFRMDRGAFGCYGFTWIPNSMKEDSWIEKAGDRWWPQCGALYAIGATKVVEGAKLVGRVVRNKKKFFVGATTPVNRQSQARTEVKSEVRD